MSLHTQLAEAIDHKIRCPRQTVSAMADINDGAALANFLRTGRGLAQVKIERLRDVVRRLEKVIQLFGSGLFDLRSPETSWRVIHAVEAAKARINSDDLELLRAETSAILADCDFSSLNELVSPVSRRSAK